MAYGDNRQQLASDAFPTEIDVNWDNSGPGNWVAVAWVSGGHVENPTEGSDASLVRTGETYADDQYCRATVQVHGTATLLSCILRAQASDDTAYIAVADNLIADEFAIYEVTNGAPAQLGGSGASGDIPMSAGEIVTGEIEGTTIRVGSSVGGDHEEDSQTDNTLTSGDPGLLLSRGASGAVQATAWLGGDIAIGGGATPKGPLGLPLFGALGGPI